MNGHISRFNIALTACILISRSFPTVLPPLDSFFLRRRKYHITGMLQSAQQKMNFYFKKVSSKRKYNPGRLLLTVVACAVLPLFYNGPEKETQKQGGHFHGH
jgi:hypothetical protein